MQSRFIPLKFFCEEFSVGRSRAYALIRRGELGAVKSGSRTMILRESAEAWAAALPRLRAADHD